MAHICSRYTARSDWPIVGHSSVMSKGDYGPAKPNHEVTQGQHNTITTRVQLVSLLSL